MSIPTSALAAAKSVRKLIGTMWTFYIIAMFAYSRVGERNIVSTFCVAVAGVFLIVNAILLVRWRIRYANFPLLDDEAKLAKRTWNVSLVFWIIMALLGLIPVILSILFPIKR